MLLQKILIAVIFLFSTVDAFAVSCEVLAVTRTKGSTLTDFNPAPVNDAVKTLVENENTLKWDALNLVLMKKTENLKDVNACRIEQKSKQQIDLKRISVILTDRKFIQDTIRFHLKEIFWKHKFFFDLVSPSAPLLINEEKLRNSLYANHEVSAGIYDYADYVTSQFQIYYSKIDKAAFVVVTPLKKDWKIIKEKDKNILTNMVRFIVPSLARTYPDFSFSFSPDEIALHRIILVPPDSTASKLSAEELSKVFSHSESQKWNQMKFWVWKDDSSPSKANSVYYAPYLGTPSDQMTGLYQDDLTTIGGRLIDDMFAANLFLYNLKPAHILLRRDEDDKLIVKRINTASQSPDFANDKQQASETELNSPVPAKDNADQLIMTIGALNGWDRPSTIPILNALLSYAQGKEPQLTLTANKKDFIDRLKNETGVFSDSKSKKYGPSTGSPFLPVLPVRPAGAS